MGGRLGQDDQLPHSRDTAGLLIDACSSCGNAQVFGSNFCHVCGAAKPGIAAGLAAMPGDPVGLPDVMDTSSQAADRNTPAAFGGNTSTADAMDTSSQAADCNVPAPFGFGTSTADLAWQANVEQASAEVNVSAASTSSTVAAALAVAGGLTMDFDDVYNLYDVDNLDGIQLINSFGDTGMVDIDDTGSGIGLE